MKQLKQIIEAALLAAGSPLPLRALQQLFADDKQPPEKTDIKAVLAELKDDCRNRGIELCETALGYQFRSKQDYAPWLAKLWEEKPARYTRALLETLALIAYRQPITRGEIEQVRGVAVSSHLTKTLLEREWIAVVGHKDVPGKPALLATTKKFLDYFNLKSLTDLPDMTQINQLLGNQQGQLTLQLAQSAAEDKKQQDVSENNRQGNMDAELDTSGESYEC